MLAKLATLASLKLGYFEKIGYVIFSVHNITKKILSCDSNHIVDMAMWPKFDNSSISIREVIVTYKDLTWKTIFFGRWFWFMFNNLRLVVGMALNFYSSVAKGLELKFRMFWGLVLLLEKLREKTSNGGGGGLFVSV